MNCMRIDPNYTTSKNGKHRKELKALLRNIYDSLGHHPGYRTIMTALHERGYKCGRQMARELLRTLWYEDEQSTRNTRELVHCYTRNTTPRPASGIVLQCCEFDSMRVRFSRLKTVAARQRYEPPSILATLCIFLWRAVLKNIRLQRSSVHPITYCLFQILHFSPHSLPVQASEGSYLLRPPKR